MSAFHAYPNAGTAFYSTDLSLWEIRVFRRGKLAATELLYEASSNALAGDSSK